MNPPWNNLKGDFEEFYLVSPIDPALLALVLEDWDIWIRWSEALDRGEVTTKTHPALPPDWPRHDELEKLIDARLSVDPANSRRLKAEFRSVTPALECV